MREIVHAHDMVKTLCERRRYNEKEKIRDAYFCISLPIPEGIILYNTLTGEMLLLSHDEYKQRYSNEEIRKILTKGLFFVPEDFDEKKYTEQIRTIVGLMQKKSDWIDSFKLFTTTDCNARCFYCFEMGKRRFSMSEETAHDVAA